MAIEDYDIEISGSGIDPIRITGKEFQQRTDAAIKRLNNMNDAIPQSERRSLRYDFTAVETHDLSIRLANKIRELDSVKEEAKSIAAQWSSKAGIISADIKKLSNNVADGWEFRDVECTIEYNKPKAGRKTFTRKDTGATFEEAMADWEWNLFTQVDETQVVNDKLQEEKPKKRKKTVEDINNDLFIDPDDLKDLF